VVEISAFLVEREFIDKSATGRDRILTRTGRSVHLARDFEAVPVHRGRFGKVIVHNDPNAIALVHLNRRARSAPVVTPEVNDPARNYLLFNRFGDEVEFLNVSVHAPGKLRNVRRFHRSDLATALGGVAPVGLQTGEARQPNLRPDQEYFSGNHVGSSWLFLLRLGGPNCSKNSMDIGSKRDARPSSRHQVAALAIPLLEEEGRTQMRRMEKDAACTGRGAGGPLSKPHTAVKSMARTSAVVLRTTALRRTTVT